MTIQNFMSLLGKTLEISSKPENEFFRSKSLIKVYDEENNNPEFLGLPILSEGVNCFSFSSGKSKELD